MISIFLLAPNENWICDRFVQEYKHKEIRNKSVSNPEDASIVWLLADWCWKNIPVSELQKKKVVCTVHHIVPSKFGEAQRAEFMMRDQYIDAYHVPCDNTKKQIEMLTNKPIYSFPFWVNEEIWYKIDNGHSNRVKYGISHEAFLIGSFQRDTEGHDLVTPKLEKGPDVFCDFVEEYALQRSKDDNPIEVLLAGWRRQYIMKRLDAAGIRYHYHELPGFATLNEFYNMLDLYYVGSRFEGGPQAVFECAATGTPILSSDAGYAPELLVNESLVSRGATVPSALRPSATEKNFDSVYDLFMDQSGFDPFYRMFEEVMS